MLTILLRGYAYDFFFFFFFSREWACVTLNQVNTGLQFLFLIEIWQQ